MSDVLDQAEIDALLNSVDSDEDPEPTAVATQTTSQAQPTDSVGIYNRDVEASTYDFKRPERVSKDQIRALASIHEVFARNFGATLSGFLRTIVDVRVVGVEQLTYNEFIHSLPTPTSFLVLEAPPLEGQMCVEISPLIIYPLIDRLMGGDSGSAEGEVVIPQRPLTAIEWRLVNRIMERALTHLSEVWKNLVAAEFKLVATESNPQLVHIVAPTEVVVFVTFEIKVGQHVGTMCLCIPFNTIESVLSKLTTQSWFYKPKSLTESQEGRLLRTLSRSKIGIRAFLGRTQIRLRDLREMRCGDLIELEKRTKDHLILQIEGCNKFAGSIGQLRGRKALRLQRTAEPDEHL